MKRMNLNFLLDATAFFGFILLTTTGVLMRYVLPPGSGHRSTIWGLDRHEWGGIHFWVAIGFFSVLALHLLLHWQWIMNIVSRQPPAGSGLRIGLGIVGVLTVVALAIAPLLTPVEKETGKTESTPGHDYSDTVRGSMTLQEIEEANGVPAAHIIESLRLPASTSSGEKLGTLKKEYGFEIERVREIVKEYKKTK